jgi:hypothetical protein
VTALEHLRRAVALNPENRSRARQDSDLDTLREDPGFRAALDAPSADNAVTRPVAVSAASAVRSRSKLRR